MTPVILTFEIDKLQPGRYRVAATCGGEVTEPGIHSSIEEAIREEALAVPDGFAHFLEVRYHGVSSGTLRLSDAPGKAQEIAAHLVALIAEMHQVAEQR